MTGRRTALFVAAWAVGLLVLGAIGPIAGERDAVALSQLPAAALATFAVALVVAGMRDRELREIPDVSVGAAALGVGLTLVGAGAAVGLWLVFLGAPVVLLGLVALVLERRAP